MSIFLVRHGETDWNTIDRLQGQTDIPLNENGKKQIREIAVSFKEIVGKVEKVISSPLSRAFESACIFSKELGVQGEIHVDHMIKERTFGQAEGLLQHEIKEQFPDFCIPNMESEAQVYDRAIKRINYYSQEYKERDILIVTHGAVLKTLLNNESSKKEKDKEIICAKPGTVYKMEMLCGEYTMEELRGDTVINI